MPGNCGLIGHIAGTIVSDGWNTWRNYARDAIEDTEDFLEQLDAVTLSPVPLSVGFDVPVGLSQPFAKPDAPDVPDLTYNEPTAPADVTIGTISIPVLDSLVATLPDEPTLSLPTAPAQLTKQAPADSVVLTPIDLPDSPALTDPDEPTLRTILLPDPPSITLSPFTAVAPSADDIPVPSDSFSFVEELYQSNLLDSATARISTMLDGGTGIPDAIWQAIWEKNTGREDRNGTKAVKEATEEWASRGFSIPPGALAERVAEVRQQVLEAKNTASRETAIQQATMEQQNIQFAVAQALALEDTLISAHLQRQARALQAQQVAVDIGINILNARVNLFNANVAAFSAQVEQYRVQLDAEIKELEVYRIQLDGARVEAELNRQEVEIFTARLQALQQKVLNYRSQIEASTLIAEQDRLKIDVYKTRVEAFGEEVRAKTAEFGAYAEQIKGELAKVQVFDSQVRAYGARIDAWKTKNDGIIDGKRIEYEAEALKLKKFESALDNYRAKVQAEVAKISARSQIFDSQSKVYAAELGAESARVESEDKQFALAVEKAKAESDLELKQAELNISQLQRIAELEQEQLKMMAQVNSSLAAGAMSAVNLSAGVQEQASNSTSCSTSYSF